MAPAWLVNFRLGTDGQYYDAATHRAYVPIYSQGGFTGGQDSYTAGELIGYRGYDFDPIASAGKPRAALNGKPYDTYDAQGNWTGSGTWKLEDAGIFGAMIDSPGLGIFSILALPFIAAAALPAAGAAGGAAGAAGGAVELGTVTGADLGAFYGGLDGAATLGGGSSVLGGSAWVGEAVTAASSTISTATTTLKTAASSLLSTAGSVATSVLGAGASAALNRALGLTPTGTAPPPGGVQPIPVAPPATDLTPYILIGGLGLVAVLIISKD